MGAAEPDPRTHDRRRGKKSPREQYQSSARRYLAHRQDSAVGPLNRGGLILSDVGASGHNLTLSETKTVGEYNLKLVATNPFGDNGGPDCKLIVTRL